MSKEVNSGGMEGVMAQGYGVIPKLVMKHEHLTIEAKAIYSYLASYAGAGKTAYPSVALMCKDLGISKTRFYNHRKLLIDYGFISVEQNQGDGGWTNNVYTLACHSFTDTRNTDPRNTDTRNKDSNNNNLNNNNINNNKLNSNTPKTKSALAKSKNDTKILVENKKKRKAKDIVDMKDMINAYSDDIDIRNNLNKYFNIRIKKGLKPEQLAIILEDLKTYQKKQGKNLTIRKIRSAIAGGYLRIVFDNDLADSTFTKKSKFDNTSERETKSWKGKTKELNNVLAKNDDGTLKRF